MVEIQDRRERSESRGVNIQKKDTFNEQANAVKGPLDGYAHSLTR